MPALRPSAKPPAADGQFAIAIHGGVGNLPDRLSPVEKRQMQDALAGALAVGLALLADGAAALDAVEQTVRVLEDEPAFNAGRGAVFNSQGRHELDAAVMDGGSLRGGAVAGVRSVKNPISLARLVLSETPHVLLAGEGVEQFAEEMAAHPQIQRVSNEYFSTEKRYQEWLRHIERVQAGAEPETYRGTVGCVVRDGQGNLAAGTSTGGMTHKRWGRVGDTPILGAGTYADNATCAVSCTGTGEHFICANAAFRISALMAYQSLTLEDATRQVLSNVLPKGAGGLVAVDRSGQTFMHTSTNSMSCARADSGGFSEVRL